MTASLKRQRRLLALRDLQADLAAADLRRAQGELSAIESQVADARERARPRPLGAKAMGTGHESWLLGCAEQELAAMLVDHHLVTLAARQTETDALSLHEQQARRDREQMQQICQRQQAAAQYAEATREQAVLDDLFAAARHRQE